MICPDACGFAGAASAFARSDLSRFGSSRFAVGFLTSIFSQVLSSPTSYCSARNFRTTVAVSLETMIANQRAYTRWLALNGIERINAGKRDIKFRASILVEQIKRFLSGHVPVAVHRPGVASDSTQLRLKRARKIDRS